MISKAINTPSNQVLSNPYYTDEYTHITAMPTVYSYHHDERYHQSPEKQTENPKITYFIMTWLHMYFKWPIQDREHNIYPDSITDQNYSTIIYRSFVHKT
jgi:hypothetical protein